MSNKFNFFSWIREGVKDAVLLGVSDAVEHIGQAREGDEVSQRLLEVLRKDVEKTETVSGPGEGRSARRLGRSLKDLESSGEKKAA